MHIQVETDDHIEGRTELTESVRAEVAGALDRFSERITRVEVHLSDANSRKEGARDKQCAIEARLRGRAPVAAHHAADSLIEAVIEASEKLARAIESNLGRLRDSRGRETIRSGNLPDVPGALETGPEHDDPRRGGPA